MNETTTSRSVNRQWARQKKFARWLGLVVFFMLVASLPLTLLIKGESWFSGLETDGGGTDGPFSNTTSVSSQGSFLRISHAETLLPSPGKDWVLLTWFNLRKLPTGNQQLILFSKYEVQARPALRPDMQGFALGLRKEGRLYRPSVFWSGAGSKESRWYEFGEVEIEPKSWFAFVLSVHNDRYMGLHLVTGSGDRPDTSRLLGGYDLGEAAVAREGEADLVIGAVQDRPFRGEIGPVAILAGKDLSGDLKEIVRNMVENPANPAGSVDTNKIRLLITDGKSDSSKFHHKVELVQGKKRLIS